MANKPLRYGYDGINDKSYIAFNGTTDILISKGNSPITADFTIFIVSKVSANDSIVFYYETPPPAVSNSFIKIGAVSGAQKASRS